MKKFVSWLLLSACAGLVSLSASAEVEYDWETSGSYSVGKAATVKIPEDGEVYLKLSGVKSGGSYTFIATGPDASVDVVYTYNDEDGDTWDDYLATGDDDEKTENQNRCIVSFESWVDANIVMKRY